jgi:monothiol glutaredoxin
MDLDPQLRERIEGLITVDEVVVFMKGVRGAPQCGFSARMCEVLDEYRERYVTFDVLADPDLREGIKAFSDWPTIPQLYVKGEFVGGTDIVSQMDEAGELAEVIGGRIERPATPEITITEAAAEQVKAALGGGEEVLRLAIDGRFHNDLFVGEAQDDDVVAESAGITLHFDTRSARRAHGVRLDFVTNDQGTGFKIDNPNAPPSVGEISVKELAARLEDAELRLYDVRTEREREIASIEGAVMLDAETMREIEGLDRATPLYFHCHHGGRSMRAAAQFLGMGFKEVYNVVGGIDRWSQDVDPSVPRY